MKNKSEWGNCSRCGKEITDDNFGDCIEAEEVYVCDSCAEKHIASVINKLEAFRKSKEYNSVLELRKKMLWISEKMGNWEDNGDKTSMESVTDYDDWEIKELQTSIIEIEINLLQNLLYGDILEGNEKEFSETDKQRERLRKKLKNLLRGLYDI